MKEWTYKLLPHLPHPPQSLIEIIVDSRRPELSHFSSEDDKYLGIKKREDWKDQSYDWIQPMASNKNMRHHFKKDFQNWIAKNITSEFQFSNSGIMFFDEPQLPHTDVTRDFVLLYNLKTGGDNSKLCFWKEIDRPLIRNRMTVSERGQHLELIDSVNGPFNCWYIMNTRIIHSVEHVTELRLNLQVSFDKEIPKDLLNNF
ncbi:MAG: hypothetical protein H7336_12715 [Bacteriovorax sp.]|nr:hypothetical protein [Bacteriovorax sp.]